MCLWHVRGVIDFSFFFSSQIIAIIDTLKYPVNNSIPQSFKYK